MVLVDLPQHTQGDIGAAQVVYYFQGFSTEGTGSCHGCSSLVWVVLLASGDAVAGAVAAAPSSLMVCIVAMASIESDLSSLARWMRISQASRMQASQMWAASGASAGVLTITNTS